MPGDVILCGPGTCSPWLTAHSPQPHELRLYCFQCYWKCVAILPRLCICCHLLPRVPVLLSMPVLPSQSLWQHWYARCGAAQWRALSKLGFFWASESAAWCDSWSSLWDSRVSVDAGPKDEQDPVPGSLWVSSADQDTSCWGIQWVICMLYGCLVFLSCSHFRWTIVNYWESLSASLLHAFWVNSSSFALANFLLFLLTII